MFKVALPKKYFRVSGTEETETFLSSSERPEIYPSSKRSLSPCIIAVLWLISSLITTTFGLYMGRRFPNNLDATCIQHTSKYCKSWLPWNVCLKDYLPQASSSTDPRRHRYIVRCHSIRWQVCTRECISSDGWPGSRCGVGGFGRELWVAGLLQIIHPTRLLRRRVLT